MILQTINLKLNVDWFPLILEGSFSRDFDFDIGIDKQKLH